MSAKLRAYVAKHSRLRGSAKAVLLAIAHYAADKGEGAYPSVATLAHDCGISETTVHRALKLARNSDELAIKYNLGPSGTNRYRVRLENIGRPEDQRNNKGINVTPGASLTPEGSSLREKRAGLVM